MGRTIFILINGETLEMYILMSAIWYYETITTTTLPLWLQLVINNDVRNRMLRIIFKPSQPVYVTHVVTYASEYCSTQKQHCFVK
ncbi:unnamed protein product [Cylicocyclus nassatus]|uniref:Uncharacterized protein n=1 Tax=Cylicocyclus nassatus TaxID=53992 RepID=A0AA36GP07_CYLNA|nr:unnamed protein product [Cylicocyclus nassatus]